LLAGGDDICVFDALVWLNYLGMFWLNDFWIYLSPLKAWKNRDSQSQKIQTCHVIPGGDILASFTVGVFGVWYV